MGTEQILRIARLGRLTPGAVALAVALAANQPDARAQQRRDAPTVPDEPVVIIDIRAQGSSPSTGPGSSERATSRQTFIDELARFRGVELFPGPDGDPALRAALAGEASDPASATQPGSQPGDTLGIPTPGQPSGSSPGPAPGGDPGAAVKAAYDRNDCAAVAQASDPAIAALAARQAAGDTNTAGLQRVYGYVLLCAHGQGKADLAFRARSRLERLGVTSAPPGVNDLVWNLYPALDATVNSELIELTIVTIPPGGVVWLDHQKLGNSPVVAVASEGPHLVAVAMADGSRGTARQIAVARGDGYDGDKQTLTLPVAEPAPATPAATDAADAAAPPEAVARLVTRWRAGVPVGGRDLGRLMTALEIRVAVVLSGAPDGSSGRAEIWALGPGETQARQIAAYTMGETRSIANAIVRRVRRWELTGPDAEVELLRESPEERRVRGLGRMDPSDTSARSQGPSWWVYAVVIGAVTVGAAFVLVDELSSDRQRIELDLP